MPSSVSVLTSLMLSSLSFLIIALPVNASTGFGADGYVVPSLETVHDYASGLEVDSLGRAVVIASVVPKGPLSNTRNQAVMRILPDGRVDTRFRNAGRSLIDVGFAFTVSKALAQPDHKTLLFGTVLVGEDSDLGMLRLGPNGEIDGKFGRKGFVYTDLEINTSDTFFTALLHPDGKITVLGSAARDVGPTDLALVRYLSNGTLDASYGNGGISVIKKGVATFYSDRAELQSDGKILIVGKIKSGGNEHISMVRVLPSGQLDSTFGIDGMLKFDPTLSVLEEDFSGPAKSSPDVIVLKPDRAHLNSCHIYRFHADGRLDVQFGKFGVAKANFTCSDRNQGFAVASNGDVLLGGHRINATAGKYTLAIARLKKDGSADESFGESGLRNLPVPGNQNIFVALKMSGDGEILFLSSVKENQSSGTYAYRVLLARITQTGALDISTGKGERSE